MADKNKRKNQAEEEKKMVAGSIKKIIFKIKKQPQLLFVILILAAVFFGLLGGYYTAKKNGKVAGEKNNERAVKDQAPAADKSKSGKEFVRRKIDGALVTPEEADKFYPAAVMIENHWDARPPSGLAQADLVYEAITEGGITRFLAFYNGGKKIKKIGPVRSARPYYLDWVSEFDALYMHVGGSNEALQKIKRYKIKDLNEYYYGGYYWRANSRPRPHNVYTSGELMEKALKLKGLSGVKPNFKSWLYKDDLELKQRPESAKVAIDYGSEIFNVEWHYNKESNDYLRYLAGRPHRDSDGSRIRAKNIAVAYMKMRVLDDVGRKYFETIGEGKAVVFLDGRAIKGVWRKKNRLSRTRFYDEEGKEIKFNAGVTWVEIVPNGYGVEF